MKDDQELRCLDVLRKVSGKASPGQHCHLSLGSQLSRAPMVLGLQGHTGLCWTERELMAMECYGQEMFSFSGVCLSSPTM